MNSGKVSSSPPPECARVDASSTTWSTPSAAPRDCILIIGFQAQGTLGRKLLDGYEHVKIYGERHRVRCCVRHINGLSAHADYREILEHLSPLASTTQGVYVVHGEENASMRFADRLVEAGFRNVEVPLYKEEFTLRG